MCAGAAALGLLASLMRGVGAAWLAGVDDVANVCCSAQSCFGLGECRCSPGGFEAVAMVLLRGKVSWALSEGPGRAIRRNGLAASQTQLFACFLVSYIPLARERIPSHKLETTHAIDAKTLGAAHEGRGRGGVRSRREASAPRYAA